MTEEILQSAITKLRGIALENYGVIKDLYHRPADLETVDKIVQHALRLAQAEGAMLTLQNYTETLAAQTEAETVSNKPIEEEEETTEEPTPPPQPRMTTEELEKRSTTMRNAMKHQRKAKGKKAPE